MKITLLVILAILTSGSAIIPDQTVNINDDLRQKKLILLEKLETGNQITAEEIRSSFGERSEAEIYLGTDYPLVISHYDIENIKESVRHELENLKKEIGNLKSSEEFVKAMDEMRKASDEIRKELEKMREEIRRTDNRTGEWENG
jgi:uncharacterized coiled-coil DUF342 family protein